MNIFKKITLRSLKENKTRTLVTIIGIILSVAMFTATMEAFVTTQSFLIKHAEMHDGKYHVGFYGVPKTDAPVITEDERVESYTYMQNIGYAEIGSVNENKPYLCIAGIPADFTDVMPIHLTAGRLPANSSEIVIPDHLLTNGGVKLQLGQKINLTVGYRQRTGSANNGETNLPYLTQFDPYGNEDNETEILTETTYKAYTVVGFCARPSFTSLEPHSAPGYTAFTLCEPNGDHAENIFTVLSKPIGYDTFRQDILSSVKVFSSVNHDLLMYSFNSFDSAFPLLVLGLFTFLIGLIVFGSVALIYNSFSISVNERTRQFGILKSIGATKKQIQRSVLYEAALLCTVGIPIGLLAGCTGIALTFYFLNDTIVAFLSNMTDLKMHFVFSPSAVIFAALIGFVTVLISAYIPAKKAIKINPIESVRQSNEIKISRKSVRISPLTQKIFGFEATLSSKNFKRNKSKYRATVFSLFVSVVLFISASSLATYFTDIVNAESNDLNYDVAVNIYNYYEDESSQQAKAQHDLFVDKLKDGLQTLEGIDEYTVTQKSHKSYSIEEKYVSDEYRQMLIKETAAEEAQQQFAATFSYTFIDDAAFRRLLKTQGLNEKQFFDKEHPQALLYDTDTYSFRHEQKEKVYIVPFLNPQTTASELHITDILSWFEIDGTDYMYSDETTEKDGITYYIYEAISDNGNTPDNAAKRYLTEDEAVTHTNISIGGVLKNRPYYIADGINLLYPESVKDELLNDEHYQSYTYIIADDHKKTASDVTRLIADLDAPANSVSVIDYTAEIETIRALVTIAKVLSYGFIVLISMISAANVFNTVTTNISLRRREFATLRSVGITNKGLRKMMTFESLLYGMKSLLFSLPVSLVATYLIWYTVSDSGYEMPFYVPWNHFVVASLSVFAIVALSMIYSVRKVNNKNTVDVLRNENI